MEVKLIKKADGWYNLYNGGIGIGSTHEELQGYKLSKQNCDDIFGVIDVEKLAIEYDLYEKINFVGQTRAYKAGFNKAMELNKDKLFTLEDMINCWNKALKFHVLRQTFGEYIQSIQQPTEIEVEIEMICPHPMDTYRCGLQYGCDGDGCNHPNQIPYLDSQGCLILKIKE